jgi:U3 small nucleolar RNA-associated protein 6
LNRQFRSCKNSNRSRSSQRYLPPLPKPTITSSSQLTPTQDEIRTLVKKRSAHEHACLAPGASPLCYARYLAWEISLSTLIHKRCLRLHIKTQSTHSSSARIFALFKRATAKHPGHLPLWVSYLDYCKKQKSFKKFKTVLTAALRLHCANAGLWVYAAREALEMESDVGGARSYLMRGTRFCRGDGELWVQYAKLEMIWLHKIAMRRKILGLDLAPAPKVAEEEEKEGEEENGFTNDADHIALPSFTPSTFSSIPVSEEEAKQDPINTPALNGAIPLAIFADAQKQPFYNVNVAESFFNMFITFTQVHCLQKIVETVVQSILEKFPQEAAAWNVYVRQPLVGVDPLSADFPGALGIALDRLKEAKEKAKDKALLARKTREWVEPIVALETLDEGVRTVLNFTLKKLE